MTAERDVTRIVRSWLEEGATSLPDHVLDAVLDQLPATPQRRAAWPARRFDMSVSIKILAAAAAVAVAFIGISGSLLPVVQGPGASPSQSPSPPLEYIWPASLQAGTYSSRLIWNSPVQFTFTVPEGWESRDVEVVNGQQGLGLMFSLVDNVFADPCGHLLTDPPIGPSVAELAEALSSLPGINKEGGHPTPTEFKGYLGEYLEFSVPEDVGCTPTSFHMWTPPPESLRPGLDTAGYVPFYSEQPVHRIRVLDVNGIRYLIDAMSAADATAEDLAELQAVVDSVRIDWTDESASIGACTLEVTDLGTGSVVEQPYTVTMGPNSYDVRGIYPVDANGEPLLPKPPLAQIDFTGENWGGRPGVGLVGPTPDDQGFATVTPVNGFQGSFVFDAPGTWVASIDGHDGCFRQLPVEVLAPPQ